MLYRGGRGFLNRRGACNNVKRNSCKSGLRPVQSRWESKTMPQCRVQSDKLESCVVRVASAAWWCLFLEYDEPAARGRVTSPDARTSFEALRVDTAERRSHAATIACSAPAGSGGYCGGRPISVCDVSRRQLLNTDELPLIIQAPKTMIYCAPFAMGRLILVP